MPTFQRSIDLPIPANELWKWHTRPGAFSRLAPTWQHLEILQDSHGIEEGSRLTFAIGRQPFRIIWEALHHQPEPGVRFTDTCVRGPLSHWTHDHTMLPLPGDGASLTDAITWSVGAGWLDTLVQPVVRRMLDRMFRQRHARTASDLQAHHLWSQTPMTFLLSGSSGLIGEALTAFLTTGGHTVRRLVRHTPRTQDAFQWDPKRGTMDDAALEGADVVIHLAGAPIADGRWTPKRRLDILESRVEGTGTLARAMARHPSGPRVFLSASAVGYYGHRPDAPVDEDATPGEGFLADVCRAWEDAAAPARDAGIRVVHPRLGMVLAAQGGALATMLPAFRAGVGGRLGSGTQAMSWISLQDTVRALLFLAQEETLSGPVNLVAPGAVSNRVFTSTLGAILRRPTVLPAPAPLLRFALGDMAQSLLLEGAHVLPARLLEAGFTFDHPTLERALAFELGRTEPT